MQETLADFLEECEFADTTLGGDDLFAILESLEGNGDFPPAATTPPAAPDENISSPKIKRQKVEEEGEGEEKKEENGQQKVSHITVERNRRKQMNEHLSVLRSLMPCFYVKRGDQASIIGGVVEYISELQQVLQSLEAKKQRKVYAEVLSPRLVPSPRPSQPVLSPRKPPLSPRNQPPLLLHHHHHHHHHHLGPISPRTPQPTSPYRPLPQPVPLHHHLLTSYGSGIGLIDPPYSPSSSSSPSYSNNNNSHQYQQQEISSVMNELVANSKSEIAEVEVKFSGANVLVKTVSQWIPGQAVKIISALEDLSLEILQVNINTIDETMLYSFTIKIGIECQLSADELAQQVQQTFCQIQH